MKTFGIFLPEPVFTHGQLYVALSRATRVNDVFVFCPNGRTTTNVVYTELLQWSFFSIYRLFFCLDGSKFPHPNHGLKFPALDAKMIATQAMFMTCGCWKYNVFQILTIPSNKNCPNLKLLTKQFSRSFQSFLLIILQPNGFNYYKKNGVRTCLIR
jgi:hypothetical protein